MKIKSYLLFFLLIAMLSYENLYAEAFKVGVIAPLSGPVAEYGVATRNGIELAVSSNPKAFSNIEFVYEDSQYDPKTALSIYHRFRQDPDVKLIFNWGANPSTPIVPIAETTCFPFIVIDMSLTTPIQRKCVLGFINSNLDTAGLTANYLVKNKVNKIAIVKVENAYINGMLEGLEVGLPKDYKVDVVSTFEASENNFRSLITKLKTKNYEALGVFLFSGQVASFYQQMKQLNYKVRTFGTDFFESKSEIERAGELMQGAVYAHINANKDFVDKYISKYKNDSQITFAASGYDFANLLVKLFANKENLTNTEIISSLKNSGLQKGVLGEYQFSESAVDGPRFRFPVYLKEIKGDSFVLVN